MECRVESILLPEMKPFAGLLLHARRQLVEAAPEILLRLGGHGKSCSLPWSISSSTLASKPSNLPAARSCCICLSHASSSHSCRQRATSARSSNVSCRSEERRVGKEG